MFKQCTGCMWDSNTTTDIDLRGDSELPKGYSIPGRLFLLYDTTKQNSDKQNAISYFTYDAPQYLCVSCNEKYLNVEFARNVVSKYDVIDLGSQKYDDFMKRYPKFTKKIGMGIFVYPDNTKSAFPDPNVTDLPLGGHLDINYEILMGAQQCKVDDSTIAEEMKSAILENSNETKNQCDDFDSIISDCDSQNKASQSDDNISVYEPSTDTTEKIESNSKSKSKSKSMHNKNFSLEEAKALIIYLRGEPLAAVAKEDQQKIFKTRKFRKYMQERSFALRKPQSYINLYVISFMQIYSVRLLN